MAKSRRSRGTTGSSSTSAGGGARSGAARPAGTNVQPDARRSRNDATGGTRRGRREHPRPVERSFLQRHRNRLVGLAVFAAIALGAAFVFAAASSPAYACSSQFQPVASADPQHQGAVQDDLGRSHVQTDTFVRYTLCPPASGQHYSATGQGPVEPRLYGPNEPTKPQGWIHNLEHGGLVLLYRCDGSDACTDKGQTALQGVFAQFPASPVCALAPGRIGPVIARFDQMPKPYAALVWGRVLYLDSLDTGAIDAFFRQEAEVTNPEPQCASPSPSASAAASAGPSESPAASPSPAAASSAPEASASSPAASTPSSPAASTPASPSPEPSASPSPS